MENINKTTVNNLDLKEKNISQAINKKIFIVNSILLLFISFFLVVLRIIITKSLNIYLEMGIESIVLLKEIALLFIPALLFYYFFIKNKKFEAYILLFIINTICILTLTPEIGGGDIARSFGPLFLIIRGIIALILNLLAGLIAVFLYLLFSRIKEKTYYFIIACIFIILIIIPLMYFLMMKSSQIKSGLPANFMKIYVVTYNAIKNNDLAECEKYKTSNQYDRNELMQPGSQQVYEECKKLVRLAQDKKYICHPYFINSYNNRYDSYTRKLYENEHIPSFVDKYLNFKSCEKSMLSRLNDYRVPTLPKGSLKDCDVYTCKEYAIRDKSYKPCMLNNPSSMQVAECYILVELAKKGVVAVE